MTCPTWKVVAGKKEGLLVRVGQDLKSDEAPTRLAKNSVVREIELHGERLHYELISGDGPKEGWVSLKMKGADLLVPKGEVPKKVELAVSSIPAPAEAKGCLVWLLSLGGREDVSTSVALGVGLCKAGYRVRLFTEKRWKTLALSVGLEFGEAGLSDEDIANGVGQEPGGELPPILATFRHAAEKVMAAADAAAGRDALPDLVLHSIYLVSIAAAVGDRYGVAAFPVWPRMPDVASMLQCLWFLDGVMGPIVGYEPVRAMWDAMPAALMAPRMLVTSTPLELEAIMDEGLKQQYSFTHKSLFTGYIKIPAEAELQLAGALFLDPQTEVEAFAQAGKPPVFIRWAASMDGAWALQLLVSALKATSLRAVIVRNAKSGITEEVLQAVLAAGDSKGLGAYARSNVRFAGELCLEPLLAKCCCAAINGGHSMVGECLRAGLPILVTPSDEQEAYYADWLKVLGCGARTGELVALEEPDLVAQLKRASGDAGVAKRAKEVQKQVSSELGVPAGILGVNSIMKNEVASGAHRRGWLEKKRVMEEAAETDEEPTDGVLRPPKDAAAKKEGNAGRAAPSAPSWLKPDGKGKILILSIPLKGHIIHLIRIATWFLEHPGYEVHFVCSEDSVPDVPKGAKIITYKHTEHFAKVDEVLAKQAHLDEDEDPGKKEDAPAGVENDKLMGDLFDFMQKSLAPIAELKPDLFITDEGLNFLPAPNFLAATCKVFKVKCLFVVSPSIKENRVRQYKAQAKLAKSSSQKEKEKRAEEPQQKEEASVESKAFVAGDNGVPEMPWKPESISMFKLAQIMRAMPAVSADPPLVFYPSSGVLYKADRYDNELFTGAFLPLPKPKDGIVQHGRADLEGLMDARWLDWLFASEDPVVYVAFGTIVSKFLPAIFISRLVEALTGGFWRVILVLPPHLQKHLPPDLAGPRCLVESFAPQGALLRCERVRCFLSHCGANSTMEAMACGVPLICMPFYMDQFDWSWAVRRHCRAAVQVSCHSDAAAIRTAVTEVLTDTAYREGAREVAMKLAHQADAVQEWLGPDMQPKASNLGPGVSVVAAIMVGLMKGEDVKPIYKFMDQSLPA